MIAHDASWAGRVCDVRYVRLFHVICNFSCHFCCCCIFCCCQVEVEIMERMAEAWQAIEATNSRHDTSHKLNREKPMFCMDRCAMCLLLTRDDPCQ